MANTKVNNPYNIDKLDKNYKSSSSIIEKYYNETYTLTAGSISNDVGYIPSYGRGSIKPNNKYKNCTIQEISNNSSNNMSLVYIPSLPTEHLTVYINNQLFWEGHAPGGKYNLGKTIIKNGETYDVKIYSK